MGITGEQVAALRAQLEPDADEHSDDFRALLSAAFHVAVRRRFTDRTRASDVIEFVGEIRAESTAAATAIDPRTAERMILAVAGDEEVGDITAGVRFEQQVALLTEMIPGAGELDAFVADARELADQWLA